jgi:hypothetical protein
MRCQQDCGLIVIVRLPEDAASGTAHLAQTRRWRIAVVQRDDAEALLRERIRHPQ